MVWLVRVLPRDHEIGVEATVPFVRALPHDFEIGVESLVWLMRVVTQDQGSGRGIVSAKETRDDCCAESGGWRGEATITGFARWSAPRMSFRSFHVTLDSPRRRRYTVLVSSYT